MKALTARMQMAMERAWTDSEGVVRVDNSTLMQTVRGLQARGLVEPYSHVLTSDGLKWRGETCLLEHGYVKPCQQDRGHAGECDKETVGLVRKTGDVHAELCGHGIKRGRKCSICTEDAAKTPKLTPAQQRALENVFADSIGDVRVDVAFCEPRVRVALEQLGLVRRSRWDLTEEGLRLIKQMGVTPRTNTYDRSDLSWLGDGAYTDARQS